MLFLAVVVLAAKRVVPPVLEFFRSFFAEEERERARAGELALGRRSWRTEEAAREEAKAEGTTDSGTILKITMQAY